jgi:hypothetical protein
MRGIAFFLMTALASAAYAGSFTLCSTGESTATTAGCGAAINSPAANNLSPDGNWYASSNASGSFLSQTFVTINNASPLQNAGTWLANNGNDSNGVGTGSAWVTPSANQGQVYANGQYYYSTQFILTAAQAATAAISGYWLSDDYGVGVYLNGIAIPQASLPVFGGVGGPMVAFNISSGFTGGNNVLTFGEMNDSTNHGTLPNTNSTTGIRVLISSATAAQVVPEPGMLAVMGIGIVGIGVIARRRKI